MWKLKIKEYFSFIPNTKPEAKYKLKKVNDNVIKLFLADINKLEENWGNNCILCLRGDSKKQKLHKEFFNNGLDKFFMVGNKAKSNYRTGKDDDFEYYEGKNNSALLKDIQKLIETCNAEISLKPDKHKIKGKINLKFLETLRNKSKSELEHWRLFFISFLHNNGKGEIYKKFKDYSPFVSLTYGSSKHSIARKFALDRAKHKIGLVYIVAVNKDKRNFIKTDEMIKTLTEFGVEWYKDRHKEIMLINGIFPHHILGLLEVKATRTPRLIINPWLYQQYINSGNGYSESGIPINQEYFDEWIKYDNLKRYFFRDFDGDEYVAEIGESMSYSKVNHFQK